MAVRMRPPALLKLLVCAAWLAIFASAQPPYPNFVSPPLGSTVRFGVSQVVVDDENGWRSLTNTSIGPPLDAWEFMAATKLAIEEINEAGVILPNRTLAYSFSNTHFDDTDSIVAALDLVDPARTANPVPLIIGYVNSGNAISAARVGKLLNVPILSDYASSTSLIPQEDADVVNPYAELGAPVHNMSGAPTAYRRLTFPTFSRVSVSDLWDARALSDLIAHFGWKSVSTITAAKDASAIGLTSAFEQRCAHNGISVSVAVSLTFPSLVFDENGTVVVPDSFKALVDSQLERILRAQTRVVLLSAFAFDASTVLSRALKLNMLGKDKGMVWVGSRLWLFDDAMRQRLSPHINGVIGSYTRVASAAADVVAFTDRWSQKYKQNRSNTLNVARPRLSFGRYDLVHLVAKSLAALYETQDFCAANFSVMSAGASDVTIQNLDSCLVVIKAYLATLTPPLSAAQNLSALHCCLLANHRLQNPKGTVLLALVRAVPHSGLIGDLAIDDRGEFSGGLTYVNVQNSNLVPVGSFTPTQNARYIDVDGSFQLHINDSLIMWPSGSREIPSDRIDFVEIREEIRSGVITGLIVITTIGVVYTVILFGLHVVWRANPVIKASSPNVNNLIFLGALMLQVFCYLHSLRSRIPYHHYLSFCSTQSWLLAIGFSLIFGSLFAKTYRVHRIFNTKRLRKEERIHDAYLFAFVGTLVLIDIVVLSLWQGVSDYRVDISRTIIDSGADGSLVAEYSYECASNDYESWFGFLLIYKSALLVFGLWLAYQVRNVSVRAMNDSKYINWSVYIVAVHTLTTAPVLWLVGTRKEGSLFAFIVVANLVIAMVESILFVPKFMAIVNHDEDQYNGNPQRRKSSVTSIEDTDDELSRAYLRIANLRREVQDLRKRLGDDPDGVVVGTEGANMLQNLRSVDDRKRQSMYLHRPSFAESSSQLPSVSALRAMAEASVRNDSISAQQPNADDGGDRISGSRIRGSVLPVADIEPMRSSPETSISASVKRSSTSRKQQRCEPAHIEASSADESAAAAPSAVARVIDELSAQRLQSDESVDYYTPDRHGAQNSPSHTSTASPATALRALEHGSAGSAAVADSTDSDSSSRQADQAPRPSDVFASTSRLTSSSAEAPVLGAATRMETSSVASASEISYTHLPSDTRTSTDASTNTTPASQLRTLDRAEPRRSPRSSSMMITVSPPSSSTAPVHESAGGRNGAGSTVHVIDVVLEQPELERDASA